MAPETTLEHGAPGMVCEAAAPGVAVPSGTLVLGMEQPVLDVRAHLAARRPVARWQDETRLFQRLPGELRAEVRSLQLAMGLVETLTGGDHPLKVAPACRKALEVFPQFGPLKTFRGKYDAWLAARDWLVLVNRARAGGDWQAGARGLPDVFLDYVAARMGCFKRGDAAEQAILSIRRQWGTGRNHRGVEEAIPGYAEGWDGRARGLLPEGWSSDNLRREIRRRRKFTAAHKALMHEGIAAARASLPQVHGSRGALRFLERVQFDDVRCDFRVFDTESGQVCDLWLLIARDVATTMLLGFGMRPARAREDGSQEHLKLQDMKQLCGWLLETYGLPPYLMTWVIEHGTATLSEAVALAMEQMLGADRIHVSWSQMIGGKSPLGYGERAIGNSKGKAMLESLNRLQHMLTSHFPGQIGLNYSVRPAELQAREREALDIWNSHKEEDRAHLAYPFYTLPQARQKLFEVFALQNHRTEHACEGFERVAEWYDAESGLWKPAQAAPLDMGGRRVRTRMESPIERAGRLVAGCGEWTRVSPEIITALYEHTQRKCVVNPRGEVEISVDRKTIRFAAPGPEYALAANTRCLGYFNPTDPRFLTLTDARRSILGVWLRRGLVTEPDEVAEAIRYSAAALRAAKEHASQLAAGDAGELERMREHNGQFVTVVKPGAQAQLATHPTASALKAIAQEREETRAERQRETEAAAESIFKTLGAPEVAEDKAADFLKSLSNPAQ
jgi:hypothetical protein